MFTVLEITYLQACRPIPWHFHISSFFQNALVRVLLCYGALEIVSVIIIMKTDQLSWQLLIADVTDRYCPNP